MELSEFLRQYGRVLPLHLLNECVFLPHLFQDFVTVVPEIGKRRVNGSHSELREIPDNLIDALALDLVPDIDVLHADTSARNPGFASAHAGGEFNMLCDEWRHLGFMG
jgi:hypothetical protein